MEMQVLLTKWLRMMNKISFSAILMLLGVFILCQICISGKANAIGLYSVSGIEVDITAASATEAREEAILEAQQRAFEDIYSRLVVGNRAQWPPTLSDTELGGLMQSFEVINEHSSAVRYIGEFTINFNEESLQDFMSNRNLRIVEYASAPVIVLPLYGSGNRWILWDSPNPWREAWLDADIDNALVPLIQPMGDLSDISTLSVRNAAVRDHASLRRLMLRYDAGAAVLVIAEAEGESYSSPRGLNLLVIRHEANGEQSDFRMSISANEGETPRDFFERAMYSVLEELNNKWKDSTAIDTAVENGNIEVYSQISTLRNWVEIQNRLREVRLVSDVTIEELSRNEVRFNLDYRGNEEQLRAALAQAGLVLSTHALNIEAGVVLPSNTAFSAPYMPSSSIQQNRRFEISIL